MSTIIAAASDPGVSQAIAYALQLGIGGVFVASLIPKLRHPRRFGYTVAHYEVLPQQWAGPVAVLVMVAEGLLALSFITGVALVAGLSLGAALLGCFAVATAINLRRGLDIDCGCFGTSGEKISTRSLARLGMIAFALLALAGLLTTGKASTVTALGWMDSGADLGYTLEVLGVAVALVVVAVWILELPTLRGVLWGAESAQKDGAIEAPAEAAR